MDDKLKPCPFCGNEMMFLENQDFAGSYSLSSKKEFNKCICEYIYLERRNVTRLEELWNTRVQPDTCKLTNIDLIEGILNDFETGISDKEETLQTLVDVIIKSVGSKLEVNVPEIEWGNPQKKWHNTNHTEIFDFMLYHNGLGSWYLHGGKLVLGVYESLEEAKSKAYDILKERVQQIVNNYVKEV